MNRLSINEVLACLNTESDGLSPDEARKRLARSGHNILSGPNRISLTRGPVRYFTHFLAMLLWIAAGLSLAADGMNLPPRPRSERLLNLPLLPRAYIFLGMIEAAIAMDGFFLYLHSRGWTWGPPLAWSSPLYTEAPTATLAGIVLAQVVNVFACRSDRHSVFQLGWFSNPLILRGILFQLSVFGLLTYSPMGNEIFGTSPLPFRIFGPLALGALLLLFAEERRKIIVPWAKNHYAGTATQPAGTS